MTSDEANFPDTATQQGLNLSAMSPVLTVEAQRLHFGGEIAACDRDVPVEAPIEIVYGAVPFAVMMATPADIEDFVVGFSLTEGIIEYAADIRSISVAPKGQGLQAVATLVPGRMSEHLQRKRSLSGRTGCGLCGIEDMAAMPAARPVAAMSRRAPPQAIERAVLSLENHQPLNDLTRAVHGAAWFDQDGKIVAIREDVGRHNALDKLIGALLRADVGGDGGFVVITSRCSFEMVEKVAAFGASLVVAISAPTSLAIERARALGVSLVAIARRDGVMIFSGALGDGTDSVPEHQAWTRAVA